MSRPNTHQLVVGDRAHRIVAAALRSESSPATPAEFSEFGTPAARPSTVPVGRIGSAWR